MPQFSPGQSKIAIVPATVQPSGLSCHIEVFLGPNESTKVATSGLKAFTSTGAQQSVAAPVVMPSASGTYHVYIDLYVDGYYLAGYQATEDVEIAAAEPTYTFSGYFTWPENILYRQAHIKYYVTGNKPSFKVFIYAATNDYTYDRWLFTGPAMGEIVHDSRQNTFMWVHPDPSANPPGNNDATSITYDLGKAGWRMVAAIGGTD